MTSLVQLAKQKVISRGEITSDQKQSIHPLKAGSGKRNSNSKSSISGATKNLCLVYEPRVLGGGGIGGGRGGW